MFQNILIISLTMSAVILLLLIISPFLNKIYSAKWRYFVWLILALRLVIPFRMELPKAPINIPPVQNQSIVFRNSENLPITIIDDNYQEHRNTSPEPADNAPIINIQQLTFILWAIGAISFFLYHIVGYAVFKRRIKPHCQKAQTSMLENILHDMNIRKKLTILTCDRISSPMMIGFIKPTILLPETEYTDAEMDVILRHELTHYKRLDLWYKLLLIIAKSIHFFNPLVYLMVKQANRDLEYSCDDAVIRNSDLGFRKQYSLTILKSMQRGDTTPLSTYLSENAESSKKRFSNILNTKNKKTGIIALGLVLALVGIAGALVVCKQNFNDSRSELAREYIINKGYTIVQDRGVIEGCTLTKDIISALPYQMYFSYSDFDDIDFALGKDIQIFCLYVKNHPLDKAEGNEKHQTLVYIVECENRIVASYSLPDWTEPKTGWVYSIDGKTLEEHWGMSYAQWTQRWDDKYGARSGDMNTLFQTIQDELAEIDENNLSSEYVIITHGTLTRPGRLDKFLNDLENKKPSEIIITQYTIEGDALFTKLIYDGEMFYGMVDDSRDKFGGEQKYFLFAQYKYLKVFVYNGQLSYNLLNDERITYKDLMASMVSSQSTAWIPHQFIMSYNTTGGSENEKIY